MDELDVTQPALPPGDAGAGPTSAAAASGAAATRSANRHVVPRPDTLIAAGVAYPEFFRFLDRQLRPESYFEIGTAAGTSLKAFSCDAVCVDPRFALEGDVLAGRTAAHFFQMSSDTFFRRYDLRRLFPTGPDICFLDGMHRSEFLLRDFLNTERACHRRSIVFLHDCLPVNARMADRRGTPGDPSEGEWRHAWTGDVWKLVPLLLKHRPDLVMFILDCPPTGLVAITGLDPASTALADGYHGLLKELRALDLEACTIGGLWAALPVLSSRSLMERPEDLTLFLDIH
jgi:hypothetical protein